MSNVKSIDANITTLRKIYAYNCDTNAKIPPNYVLTMTPTGEAIWAYSNSGATGASMATGKAGSQGATGKAGSQGATGEAGSQGATGEAGGSGSLGMPGDTGATGAQGSAVISVERLICSAPITSPSTISYLYGHTHELPDYNDSVQGFTKTLVNMVESGWSALGTGLDGKVNAIAISGSDVYVCGQLYYEGGLTLPIGSVVKWNGTAWSTVGTGFNDTCYAIAVSESNIYVGGDIGNESGIAKWNGTEWSVLLLRNPCNAIAAIGADVYVGFYNMGGGDVDTVLGTKHIAKLNGTTWSALGGGLDGNVNAIAISGSDVYVGGRFTTAYTAYNTGPIIVNRIAKYDTLTNMWSALGTGLSDICNAIAVSGTDIYVGGYFTTAGGVSASRIAKWNGIAWSALGGGLLYRNDNGNNYAICNTIAVSGSDIYVGGIFTSVNGVSANYIAKLNGTTWSALGGGLNGECNAIAVCESNIYVGGLFTTAYSLDTTSVENTLKIANYIVSNNTVTITGNILSNGIYLSSYTLPTIGSSIVIERSPCCWTIVSTSTLPIGATGYGYMLVTDTSNPTNVNYSTMVTLGESGPAGTTGPFMTVAGSIIPSADNIYSIGSTGYQWTDIYADCIIVRGVIKTFVIDHPIDTNRYLVHGCLEGPEAGVYYRGKAEISNGSHYIHIELPNYVTRIATEFTVQITPIYSGQSTSINYMTTEVDEGRFTVYGPPGKFFWHVHGQRVAITVDPMKNDVTVNGEGPYKWIA